MRTLKILGVVGSATALFLSAGIAFAEDAPTDAASSMMSTEKVESVEGEMMVTHPVVLTNREEVKLDALKQLRAIRMERAKHVEAVRTETNTMMTAQRQDAQAIMEARREDARAAMEERREEAQSLMETKREEAKAKMEERRAEATLRLANIQDEKKQQMAEKIAGRFEKLNTTWTEHFMNLLDRYDEIIQKMMDRATIATENGRDVTTATTAIESAQTAIENARASVIAQAAATYILDTASVTTTADPTTDGGQGELVQALRTAFQSLHSTLFTDLFALRDGSMKDARTAVHNALQKLSQIPGVDDDSTTETTTTNQ